MRTDRARPILRVLAYARVSSDGQEKDGTSLDAQREQLARHCQSRGLPEPVMFVEVESGSAEREEKRFEQIRLMGQARAGDLVLVCKQDRWTRDTIYYLQSVNRITAAGARFFSLGEQFDPETPEGRMASTVMAATAELERARIKERTVGNRRRLRHMGKWVEGPPPPGYQRDRATKSLVVDEEKAPVVRRMFALCVEGFSVRESSRILREEFPGLVGFDATAVMRRIRDRRYLGEMATVGQRGKRVPPPDAEWIKTHAPLVDPRTWRRAQDAVIKRRNGGRPLTGDARNADFLLRGIVRCAACGYVMTAHAPMPYEAITHGGYYVCRTPRAKCQSATNARHDEADAQVEAMVLERLEGLAGLLSAAPVAPKATKAPDFAAERDRLTKRRSNLVDAIGDGTITREQAREKLGAVEAALVKIDQREIAWEDEHRRVTPKETRAALSQMKQLRAAWKAMEPNEKREAIGMLSTRITIEKKATAERWERGAWKLRVVWADVRK